MAAQLQVVVAPPVFRTFQEGAERSVLWSMDFRPSAHTFDVIAVASMAADGAAHDEDVEMRRLLRNDGYSFHGRIMRTLWFVRDGFEGRQCPPGPGADGDQWRDQRSALKLQRTLEHMAPAEGSLALFTVAREQQRYIEEWVLYHLALGVDVVYIYDIEDVPTYHLLFSQHPQVVVIHVRAVHNAQALVLEHFLATHKSAHTWAAYLDVHEFLNVRAHSGFSGLKQLLVHHVPVRQVACRLRCLQCWRLRFEL